MSIKSVKEISDLLLAQGYIPDDAIAMSIHLSMLLKKPLLIEGPAGVGKTEIAKVMSKALNTNLIRLQCYEGLDANQAIYEWNYQRQLLYLKMQEQSNLSIKEKEQHIFGDDFLSLFLMSSLLVIELENYQKHSEDVVYIYGSTTLLLKKSYLLFKQSYQTLIKI